MEQCQGSYHEEWLVPDKGSTMKHSGQLLRATAIAVLLAVVVEAFHILHELEFIPHLAESTVVAAFQALVAKPLGAVTSLLAITALALLCLRLYRRVKSLETNNDFPYSGAHPSGSKLNILEDNEEVHETQSSSLFWKRTDRTVKRTRRYGI